MVCETSGRLTEIRHGPSQGTEIAGLPMKLGGTDFVCPRVIGFI
jgi:hypothetical protein